MLIVEKYGGSSVATQKQIKQIAKHIKKSVQNKNKLVVVVSARGKTTNKLLSLASKISKTPNKRELDVLLCTGEMQTISLLALALNQQKVKAISLCGFQANIKTNNMHGKAIIKDIDILKIKKLLRDFDCVVVAGFQGVCDGNLTTLGRGGSDTTAVSLAAKLNCPCNIFTDVFCILKANPKFVKNAKPLHKVNVDTALEMASLGARVLDTRCLEIAKKFNVPIFLGKSLEEDKTKGSHVLMNKNFEKPQVLAISEKENVCLFELETSQNNLPKILKILEKENQNLLLFDCFENKISFVLQKNEAKKLEKALKSVSKIKISENFCVVSLVGFGFSSHPKLTETISKLLLKEKIFAKLLRVNETSVSILLPQKDCEKMIQIFAKNFEVKND